MCKLEMAVVDITVDLPPAKTMHHILIGAVLTLLTRINYLKHSNSNARIGGQDRHTTGGRYDRIVDEATPEYMRSICLYDPFYVFLF